MKKLLSTLLLIVLLAQVLPFDALATVGRVLTEDELARAYALTGLGTGGLAANGDGAYHAGMRPNASWNASQLRDWLDAKLSSDLRTVNELLSQAAFTLDELRQDKPDVYEEYADDNAFTQAQALYLEAEDLRQTLRWHQDQLTEASNVIGEMSRWLEERDAALFDSDKVRYSARIEEAARQIVEHRQAIADSAAGWENQIESLQDRVQSGPAGDEDDGHVGDWLTGLLGESNPPQTNTAKVSRVSASASRANRLSMAAGMVANDVADAKITVLSENEVGIVLQTGTAEHPIPVSGVEVWVKDALDPNAEALSYPTKNGIAVVPVNKFILDEFDVLHLHVTADPSAQGFRDFVIEDMDLEKGEHYTCALTPISASANGDAANADDAPYVYLMSFAGKDIMHSEYHMIYSPVNNYQFEIKVGVRNHGNRKLLMRYYANDGGFSGLKECWAEAKPDEDGIYVFKGAWKSLFSPKADLSQRPAFMFSKNAPQSQVFTSQLAAKQSATEKPLNEGTGPNGGIFANVLGKGLAISFKIPVVEINVKLELPFQRYLPHLSVDPSGCVVIFMGKPVFEDDIKKIKEKWQQKDERRANQAQKSVEKKGRFAEYKANYNMAKDYYKTQGFGFMGESSIDVGIFAVATGRWELDKDIPDITTTNVSLRGGAGITVSYSYSWTLRYTVGPVPLYVCFTLGVSAGFAAELAVNFSLNNGSFGGFEFNPINSITIDIGFMFSAQLGIGIKGFLDAWVKLTASLDFVIHLSIMDTTPSNLTISGAITLSVGATVFFVSLSKSWNIVSGQIWPKSNAANLLAHYMNADNAEVQRVDAASDEPYRYPALAAEMREVMFASTKDRAGTNYKIAQVGDKTFMFCIWEAWDSINGKNVKRVWWRCLNPNKGTVAQWQSTEAVIEQSQKDGRFPGEPPILTRQDYDFDVYSDDHFVYLAVTCAKEFNEDGFPVRNDLYADTRYQWQNIGLYTLVLEHDGNSNLNYNLSVRKNSMWQYYICFCDRSGPIAHLYTGQNYDSLGKPHISSAYAVWGDEDKKDFKSFKIYGECGRLAYPEDTAAVGTTGFVMENGVLHQITEKRVHCAMGDDYQRVQALTLLDLDSGTRDAGNFGDEDGYAMSFVGLSKPKDGKAGDSVIELFGFDMNQTYRDKQAVVLDRGDIDHIVVARDTQDAHGAQAGRTVFYTAKETNADGATRNRLFGLYFAPVKGIFTDEVVYEVTKYSYDAVIPTNYFDVCYMGGVPYLYWVAAAQKRNENDPDVWRVWTMCYDAATNTMTDPMVFAEFETPGVTYTARYWYDLPAAPSNVILTGTGTAYVNAVATSLDGVAEDVMPTSAPVSLFSFRELKAPSATLTAAIPHDLAVKAGDFEDVSLGVRNEGNLSIATFNVSMYEVVKGVESAKPVETVHVNALDPSKCRITLGGSDVSLTDRKVAYREEDYDMTPRRRDWVLDQETTAYKIHVGREDLVDSEVVQPSSPRHVKTNVLMPGSTGTYTTAFKIPEGWKGEKTLRMKVTGLSVVSNLAQAVANGGDTPATLSYTLNEKTGKLELQQPLRANAALKAAVDSGLYANEIDAPAVDMIVQVHDLEVKHRVYRGPDGERMLDIVVHNHAATREPLTLSCAVYVDGASEPYILNLPYYQGAVSDRQTQTITLPVSALVDDPAKHKRARVEITAVGMDERAWANNEFTVDFGGEDALRFIGQPDDVTAQEGEDVSFTVEAAGGVKPYTYQWQVFNPRTGEWVDLPGFTGPTLNRKDIEKKWDGCKFRCVVTDAAGTQIISQEVTLTVRDGVDTGDHSHLPLYLAVALAALILLWWMRRRSADKY